MSERSTEYTETGELSIVRSNMMDDKNYRGYCGEAWNKGCSMPRTKWVPSIGQFKCPECGWISQYPESFMLRYKAKHGL